MKILYIATLQDPSGELTEPFQLLSAHSSFDSAMNEIKKYHKQSFGMDDEELKDNELTEDPMDDLVWIGNKARSEAMDLDYEIKEVKLYD